MPLPARVALLALLWLLLCGCGGPSPEQQRLDTTYDFTTRQLRAVSRDLMASAAYQSALESGATPLHYVIAAAPEKADFASIVWEGPVAPWTVVIKEGPGATELVVEAYGEAIDKPSRSETIDLAPKASP